MALLTSGWRWGGGRWGSHCDVLWEALLGSPRWPRAPCLSPSAIAVIRLTVLL